MCDLVKVDTAERVRRDPLHAHRRENCCYVRRLPLSCVDRWGEEENGGGGGRSGEGEIFVAEIAPAYYGEA